MSHSPVSTALSTLLQDLSLQFSNQSPGNAESESPVTWSPTFDTFTHESFSGGKGLKSDRKRRCSPLLSSNASSQFQRHAPPLKKETNKHIPPKRQRKPESHSRCFFFSTGLFRVSRLGSFRLPRRQVEAFASRCAEQSDLWDEELCFGKAGGGGSMRPGGG